VDDFEITSEIVFEVTNIIFSCYSLSKQENRDC